MILIYNVIKYIISLLLEFYIGELVQFMRMGLELVKIRRVVTEPPVGPGWLQDWRQLWFGPSARQGY